MIVWLDEKLLGQATYSVLGTPALGGVSFELVNKITSAGTALSAENMEKVLLKEKYIKNFYYDASFTLTVPFLAAEDGLSEGIVLSFASRGSMISANGILYLVFKGKTEIFVNPQNRRIFEDCLVCCRRGREVLGLIFKEGEI